MIRGTLQVDDRQVREALKATPGEIQRATRNALNDLVRAGQREFRESLPAKFEGMSRGRQFLERLVYFGPANRATKDQLEAKLTIQGPRDDILEKFEARGVKTPYRGRHIAVPVRDIRTKGGQVAPANRFRSFLPLVEIAGNYTKIKRRKGRIVDAKPISVSKPKVVGKKGTFVVTLRQTGNRALVRRKSHRSGLEVLYVFEEHTPIPVPLRFVKDGLAAMQRNWEKEFTASIAAAIRRIERGRANA